MKQRGGYSDYAIGDRVYCLAWIGQPFEVVTKDDERRVIGIQTPPNWPTFGQVDIFPETTFLLTREHWDSIWHWPDRAGERYFEVFDRFVDTHSVGEVVVGYHVPGGLLAVARTEREPERRSMMFRIHQLDRDRGQVRVHPVAAVDPANGALLSSPTEGIADADWRRSGPVVPLRIEMRLYRWCLSFGEIVLNWQDWSVPDAAS